MVYKQLRAGAGERCTEMSRAGIPLGEGAYIFLVLKAPRKVNMNLKDKLIYLLSAYSRNL